MATKIQAVSAYRPKLDPIKTMDTPALAEYIAGRTGLNRGEIDNVLAEFNEAIIYHAKQGIAVNISQLGVFRPNIRLDGQFIVNLRMDRGILRELNKRGAYTGPVSNASHIGLSVAELVELWNKEHPDDPVEA